MVSSSCGRLSRRLWNDDGIWLVYKSQVVAVLLFGCEFWILQCISSIYHATWSVCHVACAHLTSATNILKRCWRHIRPRRFVTFYISALEILSFSYFTYFTSLSVCIHQMQDSMHNMEVLLDHQYTLWSFARMTSRSFAARVLEACCQGERHHAWHSSGWVWELDSRQDVTAWMTVECQHNTSHIRSSCTFHSTGTRLWLEMSSPEHVCGLEMSPPGHVCD